MAPRSNPPPGRPPPSGLPIPDNNGAAAPRASLNGEVPSGGRPKSPIIGSGISGDGPNSPGSLGDSPGSPPGAAGGAGVAGSVPGGGLSELLLPLPDL